MIVDNLNITKSQLWPDTALAHLNISTLTTDGSLAGHFKVFLISCKVNGLSHRTISDYAQKIGAFVAFCNLQGATEPKEIAVNHVRIFILSLQERIKAVSVHDYYGCVNRFFNWLCEENIIENNPMARLRPPKVPKQIIEPFSLDDIKKTLTLCGADFLGYRNRAIILTFLDSGLRLSELASVQLASIDFDKGIVKVTGKGNKDRIVRIGRETQKAILRYLLQRHDNYPCLWVTEERKPLAPLGIQAFIRRLGKRAGIVDARCSPHTFRHTFAITCLRNGIGEFNLQCLLGHTTLQMTHKYVTSLGAVDAIRAHEKASPVDNMRL